MEDIYDPALRLEGWWDPDLLLEGWFGEEFTEDAGLGRNGPTFVAASSANSGTGTGTAFSLTLPAGITDGDYAYMAISMNTQNDRGDPAGWTLVDFSTSGTVLQLKTYRKSMLASESSTNVTFTLSNAQKWDATVVIVHADGGLDTDTELFSTGATSSAWTAGAVTPTVDDTLLLCFHAARVAATGTFSETAPTGWTQQAFTSNNAAASPSIGNGAYTQEVTGGNGVSSGADTDGTVTSASNQLSFVLAVKPVAGGTPATASGSITLAGSAAAAGAATAAGSLTLGGSATAQAPITATGSVTLGGSGTAQAPVTASGSVTLGGSATAQAAASATGSVTLGGAATAQAAATASGSITLAGSATAVDSTGSTASGSITLAGSATAQAAATASGSVTLSGSAAARAAATAAGSITLGGSATSQAPLTATGSVTLGGSATAQARATASGSVTLTATAGAQGRATATGSITLTGTADAAAGGGLIPGFARETFPARTKASLTLTGTTARDTVRAGTTVRFGGTGARTHEFTPSHATAKEPQHV